jgi:hypothetical protein
MKNKKKQIKKDTYELRPLEGEFLGRSFTLELPRKLRLIPEDEDKYSLVYRVCGTVADVELSTHFDFSKDFLAKSYAEAYFERIMLKYPLSTIYLVERNIKEIQEYTTEKTGSVYDEVGNC